MYWFINEKKIIVRFFFVYLLIPKSVVTLTTNKNYISVHNFQFQLNSNLRFTLILLPNNSYKIRVSNFLIFFFF